MPKNDTTATAAPTKVARIPADIYEACEKKAHSRRKKTGADCRWTQVLYQAARATLGIKA